jgi:hypothetical protein
MHGRSALLAADLSAQDTLSLHVNYAARVAGQPARLVLTSVREILSSGFVERASEQLPWFAVVLLVSVAITSLFSRERRRRLGLTRFLLGYLCIAAVPLFGVIVLRSALREGLEQAGHGSWRSGSCAACRPPAGGCGTIGRPAATSGATGWHAGSASARAIDDASSVGMASPLTKLDVARRQLATAIRLASMALIRGVRKLRSRPSALPGRGRLPTHSRQVASGSWTSG